MRMPGSLGATRRSSTMMAIVLIEMAMAARLKLGRALHKAWSLGTVPAGFSGSARPSRSPDLADEQDHGDPRDEADGHGIGDELGCGSWPSRNAPRSRSSGAGHDGCEEETIETMAADRGRDEDSKRRRWTADLEPASTQRRYQEAADGRGKQAAVRRNTRGDRDDGHRQGRATMATVSPGDDIGAEVGEAVPRGGP